MGGDQVIIARSFITYCTAALLLLCSIFNSSAQEANYNDLGTWTALNISVKPSEKVTLTSRFELRTEDNASALNQFYGRLIFQYKAAPWLRLDNNIDYATTPSGDRFRWLPGFQLGTKTAVGTNIYLRQWMMYTRYLGTDRSARTFRTKVGASQRVLDSPFTPHLDYEFFYWDAVSQHRFYLGNKIKLGEHNSVDLFYLYQLLPLKEKGTHIAGITWTVAL